MKTMEQWNNSLKLFGVFCQPGDEIDKEIYQYFLEILPPAAMKQGAFLVGEPARHNNNGHALYDCFVETQNDGFYYLGELTEQDVLSGPGLGLALIQIGN